MALIVSFYQISWLELRPSAAVLLYSLATALSQLAMLVLAWRTTRRAAASTPQAAPDHRHENQ